MNDNIYKLFLNFLKFENYPIDKSEDTKNKLFKLNNYLSWLEHYIEIQVYNLNYTRNDNDEYNKYAFDEFRKLNIENKKIKVRYKNSTHVDDFYKSVDPTKGWLVRGVFRASLLLLILIINATLYPIFFGINFQLTFFDPPRSLNNALASDISAIIIYERTTNFLEKSGVSEFTAKTIAVLTPFIALFSSIDGCINLFKRITDRKAKE